MRKYILGLVLALTFAMGAESKADNFNDQLLLYIPNRAMDLMDMFSLKLGFGPKIKLEGRLTRFIAAGGGIGTTANLVKEYNRQYGCDIEDGWDTSIFWFTAEDSEVAKSTRGVKKYWYQYNGIPTPTEQIYDFHEGARDYWEIGGECALLLNVHFALHPVDIADFFTGLVFIDLKGDDLTIEDFEN